MKQERIDLEYVINFEMIGKEMQIGENKVYLTGYEMSNLAQEINKVVQGLLLFSKSKEFNLFQRSDNYPFYKNLIFLHKPYHLLILKIIIIIIMLMTR